MGSEGGLHNQILEVREILLGREKKLSTEQVRICPGSYKGAKPGWNLRQGLNPI